LNEEKHNSKIHIWLLFDWGDTLMRVYPKVRGPMTSWPRVAAVPGAAASLASLSARYHLAVATNAADSDEDQIRAALKRGGLDTWIEQIFCARNLGFQKPQAEYFQAIIKRLISPPNHMVMIGDSYSSDVQGAVQAGLSAIWFNPLSKEQRQGAGYCTVHGLSEIETVLQSWFPNYRGDSYTG